jgi:hypothetical protein
MGLGISPFSEAESGRPKLGKSRMSPECRDATSSPVRGGEISE